MSSSRVAFGAIVCTFVFYCGCSTMKVDRSQLSGIKKVAIVGFSVMQKMPPDIDWSVVVGGGGKDIEPHLKIALAKASPHADKMYLALARTLKKEMKWTVLSQKAVYGNSTYKKLYRKYTRGFQSRPPIGKDKTHFGAKGIIDAYPIERMNGSQRRALAKKLGADALAVATLNVDLKSSAGLVLLVGAGSYTPQAAVRFTVYEKGGEKAAWQDVSARGAEAGKVSAKALGIAKTKSLLNEAIVAAKSSYQKLIARYRENK